MQTVDRETARQAVRAQIPVSGYLTKAQRGGYICPLCGSGTGPNKTGAVKIYDNESRFYCHACGRGGDVLDLYQKTTGADYNTALLLLAGEIGYSIGSPEQIQTATRHNRPTAAPPAQEAPGSVQGVDYTAYYAECSKRLEDPAALAYLQRRGISLETAKKCRLGYDPEADPAKAPGIRDRSEKKHPAPRVIIPTTKLHYIGRAIDPQTPAGYQKMNPRGTKPGIFNEPALYAGETVVFVVEGAFDALSVIEAGAEAIALNSTSNTEILLERLKEKPTNARLIVAFDNDSDPATNERTRKREADLIAGLQALNIPCMTADITGSHKDANDRLTADPDGLKTEIRKAAHAAQLLPRPEAPEPMPKLTRIKPVENVSYYLDNVMAEDIDKFRCDIKTGYSNLDQQIGGLYAGLYVIAAISSLGKTTFALQMADQIAGQHLGWDENGNAAMLPGDDVLYFSLEQSRLEMVSKSLARITAQNDLAKSVTSLSIRKGRLTNAVMEAVSEYKDFVGDRMNVIEGNFTCDISFIGEYVREYMRERGTKPVLVIDYLQILQPEIDGSGRRQTTKDVVDATVTELKRLSREQGLTVIAISSVNRANYLTPISFESLKESGSIEYTADVVFGLQLGCLADPEFDKKDITEKRREIDRGKEASPREIDLVCLKNRYGKARFTTCFRYYPEADLFLPDTERENARKAGSFGAVSAISAVEQSAARFTTAKPWQS